MIVNKMTAKELKQRQSKAKKNKFGAIKTEFDGITFDSKGECEYYQYLLTKHKKEDIKLQPEFILQEAYVNNKGKKIRSITYRADFQIGNTVIDFKGMETEVFKIKKKLFEKLYPEYDFQVVKN